MKLDHRGFQNWDNIRKAEHNRMSEIYGYMLKSLMKLFMYAEKEVTEESKND